MESCGCSPLGVQKLNFFSHFPSNIRNSGAPSEYFSLSPFPSVSVVERTIVPAMQLHKHVHSSQASSSIRRFDVSDGKNDRQRSSRMRWRFVDISTRCIWEEITVSFKTLHLKCTAKQHLSENGNFNTQSVITINFSS